MKTSSLSGKGAVKLLLLLTSLGHHYSGLVTGADPDKGICASLEANKPVDFFLVGRNSSGRLLITAKPDYLVYDLPDGSLLEDTLNISVVVPVPLSVYYPELFTNEHFKSLDAQSGKVVAFTQGTVDNDNTYLKMLSVDLKLLVTFNMGPLVEPITATNNFTAPDASQEFVSATDTKIYRASFYSFYLESLEGSIRKKYNLDYKKDMNYTSLYYTCKGKKDNLLLRLDTCGSYQNWNWASSPKGWAETLDANSSVRFYLFELKNQMVSIFNQKDIDEDDGDVISVVRQKTYKDFFVCPAPKVTTSIPSTSSDQPSTTSNVTEVANRTSVTSATPARNASSSTKASPDSVQTSTEKPKFAVWIIILIVVLLLAIIITVLALAWYYYGGKKTSDTKPDKIASKGTMPKVRSTVSGGKQSSVITSKVLSTKVIPSKVASSAGGKAGGISPAGSKLKANSSAASKASIRSSMVVPSKGPEVKVQGLKAKQ